MPKPVTKVEIAFNVGVTGSPTWTDVTSRVRVEPGISIDHWRSNEGETTNPSSCSFTLINNDGRFTPGNTSSIYYPNVLRNRRVRVTRTTGGVTYQAFNGYVDDWAVDWPAGVTPVSDCRVSATSRMSRLGRGVELASSIEVERLLDAPIAYYTLGDPEGSTQAADTSGNSQAPLVMVGTGSDVAFGNATGPAGDDLTAATFSGGKWLQNAIVHSASPSLTVECFFSRQAPPAGPTTTFEPILCFGGVMLAIEGSTGDIVPFIGSSSGTLTVFLNLKIDSAPVCDGETHHILFHTGSGDNFFVDGAAIDASGGGVPPDYRCFLTGIPGEPNDLSESFRATTAETSVAHAALYEGNLSLDRIQAHAQGRNLSDTEAVGDAIVRLARYGGVPDAEVDATSTTEIPYLNPAGATALDAMRRIEVTENGVLYDALDGTLTLNSRDHRYNATSAFTLDARTGAVAANLFPVLDDQGQVNDITVTNRLGVAARAFDQDSIDRDGYYKNQVELVTDDPDEPAARAGWVVNGWADPDTRVSEVEVALNTANATVTAGVLNAQPGTMFTLTGLPANAPASSMTLFVEGRSERITQNEDRITLRTSPTGPYDVFEIADNPRGTLDSIYRIAY